MTTYELLLEEGPPAPGSLWVFVNKFEDVVGTSTAIFKDGAEKVVCKKGTTWYLNGYALELALDCPHYKLLRAKT